MDANLSPTRLLNFKGPAIRDLIGSRGWRDLALDDRISAIYDFVRNEIPFGYNRSDDLPASMVLTDGYGQCKTKATLLMALLRGSGVPCRFHGATILKELQKGVVEGFLYGLAPENIIHSWAEIRVGGNWIGLEGVVLDDPYLDGLCEGVARDGGTLLCYGAGTENIGDPPVEWCGTDTAIQATEVNQDFGVFDGPDGFYREHGANLTGPKGLLFRKLIRHQMNRKVSSIRNCAVPTPAIGKTGHPTASDAPSRMPSKTLAFQSDASRFCGGSGASRIYAGELVTRSRGTAVVEDPTADWGSSSSLS